MKENAAFPVSFEFFPPKTPEGLTTLLTSAKSLTALSPEFFSMTFGAGGSTITGTIENVKMLQQATDIQIVPHLSCIGGTRDELSEMLRIYKSLNVKRIVALRGDLPSGMVQSGEFRYASDLVKLVREVTGNHFHIDVAAYPEFHPQAKSPLADILNLKNKFDLGANSAITQYFFNPDAYFYYLDECASNGITKPIVPGIMPITQFTRLARFSDICGAEIPLWIRKRLQSFGDDSESIIEFGVEVVYNLCQRLIRGGAPGLHFYTLNKADASMRVVKMLNLTEAKTGVRNT